MVETVAVGCRLPNGLRLEVGFKVNERGNGGAPFALYRKLENYESFLLKGTNQHLILRNNVRKVVAVLPNQRDREPFINQVPKEFWDAWVKANPKSWHLTSGNLFAVPKTDASTVKAASIDAKSKSAPIFEPLDPAATMKLEDVAIQRREEEE